MFFNINRHTWTLSQPRKKMQTAPGSQATSPSPPARLVVVALGRRGPIAETTDANLRSPLTPLTSDLESAHLSDSTHFRFVTPCDHM